MDGFERGEVVLPCFLRFVVVPRGGDRGGKAGDEIKRPKIVKNHNVQ